MERLRWPVRCPRKTEIIIAKLHVDTISFRSTRYIAGKKLVEEGKLLY
jgi:hypothetical protein